MKSKLYLAIFLMIFFSLSISTPALGQATHWTFMIYLDGDCDLESDAIIDFLEMAEVGSNTDVNIVVQFDRIDGWNSQYGNWTTCKRFYVTDQMIPTPENALEDLGEANMGDPSTLSNFIDWSINNFPATNYALVLWNHGGGWRSRKRALEQALIKAETKTEKDEIKRRIREIKKEKPSPFYKAVCYDDTNGGDSLNTKEVQYALNSASGIIDLIGFDACLMSMIEVAYEIRDTGVNIMVGSEEYEPAWGWPYQAILADMQTNPAMTPSELSISIVDRYYESYSNDFTLSAININQIDSLANVVSCLAEDMQIYWHTNEELIQDSALMVMEEIEKSVIHERHGSFWPEARGLAIYFPANQWQFDIEYNETVIDFASDTLWDDFLSSYYQEMTGSWIDPARHLSQTFYNGTHIDLYSFCNKLSINPEEVYFETLLSPIFFENGIAQNWKGDDNSWSFSLPFAFPFFNNTYTSMWVCSNGFIDFISSDYDFENSFDKLIQNVRIAPLWTDLISYLEGDIYIDQPSEDSVCIRWVSTEYWDEENVNVEVILYKDGRIQFNYGNGNTTLGSGSGRTPTIGISGGDGVNYCLSSYNGYDTFTYVNSVLFTPGCEQMNTYYRDEDNDGYGDPSIMIEACEAPDGYVPENSDCDDSDTTINIDADEICDGQDNDCDGEIDEGVMNTYYRDEDNDGYGDPDNAIQACSIPENCVENANDTNDNDSSIGPSQSGNSGNNQNNSWNSGFSFLFYSPNVNGIPFLMSENQFYWPSIIDTQLYTQILYGPTYGAPYDTSRYSNSFYPSQSSSGGQSMCIFPYPLVGSILWGGVGSLLVIIRVF